MAILASFIDISFRYLDGLKGSKMGAGDRRLHRGEDKGIGGIEWKLRKLRA